MAKQQTVFLNVAFDKLRGKLATKQLGILYSGQVLPDKPSMLPVGAHNATNFRKYIVLNERNGKTMFYVKSRQTLGVSSKTSIAWAALAAAASMANSIVKTINSATSSQRLEWADIIAAFEYWRQGQDLRLWLTGVLVRQLRAGHSNLEIDSAPDAQGLTEKILFGYNPFVNGDVPTNATDALVLMNFMTLVRQRVVYLNYVEVLAKQGDAHTHSIKVVTNDLRERRFTIVADGLSYDGLSSKVNGRAIGIVISGGNVQSLTFYNPDGSVFASGTPYRDEAHTTVVPATDTLTDGEEETVYIW